MVDTDYQPPPNVVWRVYLADTRTHTVIAATAETGDHTVTFYTDTGNIAAVYTLRHTTGWTPNPT